jgi:hypothetical protein
MGPIMPQLLVMRCVARGRWVWLSITRHPSRTSGTRISMGQRSVLSSSSAHAPKDIDVRDIALRASPYMGRRRQSRRRSTWPAAKLSNPACFMSRVRPTGNSG